MNAVQGVGWGDQCSVSASVRIDPATEVNRQTDAYNKGKLNPVKCLCSLTCVFPVGEKNGINFS